MNEQIIKNEDGSVTKIRNYTEVEHHPPTSGSKGLDYLIGWLLMTITLVFLGLGVFILTRPLPQSQQNNPVIINNN